MGPTFSPETSAFKLQTPGKFPKEYKLQSWQFQIPIFCSNEPLFVQSTDVGIGMMSLYLTMQGHLRISTQAPPELFVQLI